jgi:hypothetical protein
MKKATLTGDLGWDAEAVGFEPTEDPVAVKLGDPGRIINPLP